MKEVAKEGRDTSFLYYFSSFFDHVFPLHIKFKTMIFMYTLDFPMTIRKKKMELYPKHWLQLSKEC